ncbi:MAG: hypothetical protein B6D59_03240 [Campylobacteraceae bacterium 4484_4]|nr:MAG: hypothetical protein B6D59_03240 [Campylobacteraceae bacterium 4484_4]
MELKDLVLSTLEELDKKLHTEEKDEAVVKHTLQESQQNGSHQPGKREITEEERRFLLHTRERLSVLFEGLQQERGDPEAKLEMTLKFLQYYLGLIEERLSSSEE